MIYERYIYGQQRGNRAHDCSLTSGFLLSMKHQCGGKLAPCTHFSNKEERVEPLIREENSHGLLISPC